MEGGSSQKNGRNHRSLAFFAGSESEADHQAHRSDTHECGYQANCDLSRCELESKNLGRVVEGTVLPVDG